MRAQWQLENPLLKTFLEPEPLVLGSATTLLINGTHPSRYGAERWARIQLVSTATVYDSGGRVSVEQLRFRQP